MGLSREPLLVGFIDNRPCSQEESQDPYVSKIGGKPASVYFTTRPIFSLASLSNLTLTDLVSRTCSATSIVLDMSVLSTGHGPCRTTVCPTRRIRLWTIAIHMAMWASRLHWHKGPRSSCTMPSDEWRVYSASPGKRAKANGQADFWDGGCE